VNDPLYKFLDQGGNWARAHLLNSFINFSLRAVIGLIWGWEIAAASLFSALFVQQIPFLLNVVCHIPRAGYRNFNTLDESVNVGWVAFLTLGEGWHNNHHAFPGSARHGLKPTEFDVTWLILRALKKLGLVSWMNEASVNATYKGPQGLLAPLVKPGPSVALPAMAKSAASSKSGSLAKTPALPKAPTLASELASELVRGADLVPAAVPAQAIVPVVHPGRGRR
jgi:hypothetical protein